MGAVPQSNGELRMNTLGQVLYWRSDWTIQTKVVKKISFMCLNENRSQSGEGRQGCNSLIVELLRHQENRKF